MGSTHSDPGRVLIVRVWREPAVPGQGFRARITMTADMESGRQETAVAASPGAVLEVVSRWLAKVQP